MANDIIEVWEPVFGYENLYEISTFGNIRALPKRVDGRKGVVLKRKARDIKPCIWGGYYTVVLCRNNHRKTIPIHRVVAINFISNPDNGQQVNHKDGNKLNNHVDNLEWCTAKENMQHAFATGLNRGRIGTENTKAKITEKDVIEIRKLSECGKNGNEIAEVFNLNASTVNRIISRKYWKHVVAV